MFKFLKKDSFWLGLAVGTLLPLIVTVILYFVVISFPNSETGMQVLRTSTVFILGIVPNALLLRYYLVNLKADKTGRGILLVTFVFAIIYFVYYYL
jgi:membrane protein YdbS with pleckstrin-like domain